MKFINFKPAELTENEWHEYFRSRERLHHENNPRSPLPSTKRRRDYMLDPHPDYILSWWRAESEPGAVVGMGGVWWAKKNTSIYKEAKDTAYADMILEQEYANDRNEIEFLRHLTETAQRIGKSKLIVETRAEHQQQLLQNLGFDIVSQRATYRLHVSDVNLEMIEHWRSECAKKAPGVAIERHRSIPDEDLVEYAKIYTETWNQAPLENAAPDMIVTPESRRKMESYFESQGEIWTTILSREPDSTISGLTEIWYNPELDYYIEQGLTGVKEQYRGRSIGKWLKAEMLAYILREYPKATVIETGNADTNAPMRSINQQLGFRHYRNLWILSTKVNDLLSKL
ncbi:MAG: hypothetical protein JW779_03605 [Candidatus Thorarchaeota archaeon]|nr:hypothetical protein [Candidatus Thorarchaeota archaeon]